MKKSYWIAVAVLGIVFLLVLLVGMGLLGYWNNGGWGMMGRWPSGMMHGWGFTPLGWIGMILMWLVPASFLVLVIVGIVGLVRGLTSGGEGKLDPNQRAEAQPSPLEILQIRYARGEINREQYLEILADLN
jgi:putative membrane protein